MDRRGGLDWRNGPRARRIVCLDQWPALVVRVVERRRADGSEWQSGLRGVDDDNRQLARIREPNVLGKAPLRV